jgi:hypothetical protein
VSQSRYVLTDADVVLELTKQQAAVLSYVLQRAQEEREVFEGRSPDPAAASVMRSTISRTLTLLREAMSPSKHSKRSA